MSLKKLHTGGTERTELGQYIQPGESEIPNESDYF